MNVENATAHDQLHLAHHIRACVFDDQVVLLDLHRSRYIGLRGPHARIVASAIDTGAATKPRRGYAHDTELVAPLLRAQILTTAPSMAPRRQPPVPPPIASLDVRDDARQAAIRPLDIYRFVSATGHAALWLRFRTLRSITEAMHARLSSCEAAGRDHALRLRRAVAVFDRLRPLAFTSRDKCLFDSLALMIFLSLQGMSAHWVIGVSTRPFRAHSWIQNDGEVLNDLHDHVRQFTPILVV